MRIKKNSDYAVVTGDVISSSRLSLKERKAMHRAMTSASKSIRKSFGLAMPFDVDTFRGDGWQMLLTDPSLSLRIALFYRAELRARMQSHHFDIRMAIAIGKVDFVPGDQVSDGDGPAYRLSGKALDTLSRSEHMRLIYPESASEDALDVMVQLVDCIAARWTDKQAAAVTGALQGWNQEKISKKTWVKPITQQAVAQHLNRANWDALERAVKFFEGRIGG